MVEELSLNKSEEKGFIDYAGIEELFPMMTKDDLNKVEQMIEKDAIAKKKMVSLMFSF